MRASLFFFSFIILGKLFSQAPFAIKEHYDKIYFHYSPLSFNYNDCYYRANSLSWTMSGLIRQYQTTGDRAYLVKFINHAIKVQKVRWDEVISGQDPVWIRKPVTTDCPNKPNRIVPDDLCDPINDKEEASYFNSLLIYPMAEFVNMVLNEPGHVLYNTNLPVQPSIGQDLIDLNTLNSMSPGFPILGYGDFANWLGKRIEETIINMNTNYWGNVYGIQSHYCDDCNSSDGLCGAGMNMQSVYGSALLFMGLANTNFGYGNNSFGYLHKARLIASLYKQTLNLIENCNPEFSGTYNHPELRLLSNNSYYWYTRALSMKYHNCWYHTHQPDISWYTEFVEDVAHGAMDLFFVRACYNAQLAPLNSSSPYFTFTELERFRNTLTKNIYYTDNTGVHFHNNVNGTNNPSQADCSPNCPPDLNLGEVLDWMPLYPFDGNSQPNVYDILLNHAIALISSPSTEYLTGSQSHLGLSEVVKAQWELECVDLTLFNRNVVYNQDFWAKNILTLYPSGGPGQSFADPITSQPEFTVEPGVTSNMYAAQKVILKPGTKLKNGSNVRVYIQEDLCQPGDKRVALLPSEGVSNTAAVMIPQVLSPTLIHNNPVIEVVTFIVTTPEEGLLALKIVDMLGKTIAQPLEPATHSAGSMELHYDVSTLPPGIYFCILQAGLHTVSTRLVKNQ